MSFIIASAPHEHHARTVGQIMQQVLYALLPAIAAMVWYFGWNILINLAVATATAVITEISALYLRDRPIRPFISDFSAIVTAWLLALAVPPLLPAWMLALATAFCLIFAKHLYGGLGYNPFNPAMVGYVLLLISFPAQMTHWDMPTAIDGFSGATPLDAMKMGLRQQVPLNEILQQPIFSHFFAHGWGVLNLAYLIGGLWLIYQRVITWHIPVAFLGGLTVMSLIFMIINPQFYPTPFLHLFVGATMLCAFFIATDPVSAATSPLGRLYYAAGIGILVYVIRTWGGYPDGVAFAVLLMNIAAPSLDYFTQPRVFGRK